MCIVDIAPCAFSKTSEGGLLFTSGISPVEDLGPRGKANLFIPKSDFRIFAFLKEKFLKFGRNAAYVKIAKLFVVQLGRARLR